MFGEIGEIAVVDVLGYEFPRRLAVFVDGDGSESGGCNVLDQVQANRWAVCDAKSLGVRMAQVTPSTEIPERANCVCAEDACRCWTVSAVASCTVVGSEESVRPCGPSSGLQGNEASRCELVLDGFDCCNLEWKLYESAPGDGFVEQSRGLPRERSHLYNDHGIGIAGPDKELDEFALAAICYADDVVLIAVSMSAAEIMVTEVIAKLKEVGLSVGAQKTHWTSCPKIMDKSIMDGLAVLWEEVLEFVGSKVCLDGNARHAIAHRYAQANKCMAKWRPVLSSSWLPRLLRLNIVKTTMW